MALRVDLFWSFRSPYSYLALGRLEALARDFDVDIAARPVYPLAVRDPSFFKRTDPRFVTYLALDTQRVAQREGIPYRFPRPDPIEQNLQTLEVAAEQPRIRRLMRLAAAAQREGRAWPMVREVGRLLWSGQVERWDEGTHLADALTRAGLNPGALEQMARDDVPALEALIEQNQDAHARSGHWGVPTMVFQGEPFFGQDRIDLLTWRLQQHGLQRRLSTLGATS